MDDTTIISQILARDETALSLFYRTYAPQLTRFLKTKINNPHDVEEVLQDTLFAFLESIRDFEGKAKIRTFLFAICNHKIIDYYRRKKIQQTFFSQMPELEELISPLLGPEEQLDRVALHEKLRHTFTKILPQYKMVLQARYILNIPVGEIAQQFSVTIKSTESLITRARKAFVKAYER